MAPVGICSLSIVVPTVTVIICADDNVVALCPQAVNKEDENPLGMASAKLREALLAVREGVSRACSLRAVHCQLMLWCWHTRPAQCLLAS
jgi:hypothetical protein